MSCRDPTGRLHCIVVIRSCESGLFGTQHAMLHGEPAQMGIALELDVEGRVG